jgi:hypothetical protein
MPVARHPPHRSVLEGLLHTAPTLGNSRKAANNRCLTYPVKSVQCLSLSLCTGRRRLARIPLGHQPSLRNLRCAIGPLCSAPSSVLRRCQTAQQRACRDYGHRPSPTDPMQTYALDTAELSRFSNIECPRMHRFSDSAGPGNDWLVNAVAHGAFPFVVRGRRPGQVISELNGWPAFPLSNASRAISRPPAHDSGP